MTDKPDKNKIIFFGLGSIGLRHLSLLQNKCNFQIYSFCRNKTKKPIKGVTYVYNWAALKKIHPNIAFITNPTHLHVTTAIICAKLGMNLFIEKPLSHSMKGISSLIAVTKKKKINTYIAYCLRFHPVIHWLKKNLTNSNRGHPLHIRVINTSYLPNWRPGKNYKSMYSAYKNQGGGVILDLSHEIDYLVYLFGNIREIKGTSSRISNVTVDSEDFADILLKFNTSYCNLHLNFLSHDDRREIYIDFKDKTIIGDLVNNTIAIKGNHRTKTISLPKNDMYRKQLDYFFTRKNNMNTIADAKKILAYILACKRLIK